MLSALKPFALCAAMVSPVTVFAQELTAEDYLPPRVASIEELEAHCNAEDNPDQAAQLLSFSAEDEYPFQIIVCRQAHVSSYKCSTLSNLINFEFDIKTALSDTGIEIDADDPIAGQFTGLFDAYDAYCQHLLY